jgi:hypothetical protein
VIANLMPRKWLTTIFGECLDFIKFIKKCCEDESTSGVKGIAQIRGKVGIRLHR